MALISIDFYIIEVVLQNTSSAHYLGLESFTSIKLPLYYSYAHFSEISALSPHKILT